jgi:outer membrane autotransporter protein
VINVNELHTASQASFNGTQWGAQMDLGWALGDCESYYFAPFARLKYIHLNLDQYTQNGAGDIGLTVDNNHNQEFLGGIGFRLGSTCHTEDMLIVPELSALVAYDFKNDGEQSVAGFIGGGPAFETNGIKPGRTIFDLGLGINAHFCNDSIFSLKYDLEVRSKFIENIFYVQYNYFWS